ncbi:MAG: hypothetical protein ACRC16_15480 [Aeromonas salmonicida]
MSFSTYLGLQEIVNGQQEFSDRLSSPEIFSQAEQPSSPSPEGSGDFSGTNKALQSARDAISSAASSPMQSVDRRARISGPPSLFSGPLLQRLLPTGGLLFPYTPTVIYTRNASYDDFHFTHSNYKYHQFQASTPGEIQVIGEFTAQTDDEAVHLLAAIRFLKSMQLSEFGLSAGDKRGVPPPVLRFNYLGGDLFKNVPVVIGMANFNFEPGMDYVPVKGFDAHVPTKMNMTVTLLVQPNPKRTIEEFSVEGFKSGALIKKGYI